MWFVRTPSWLFGREKSALYNHDPLCDEAAECGVYMMDVLRVFGLLSRLYVLIPVTQVVNV